MKKIVRTITIPLAALSCIILLAVCTQSNKKQANVSSPYTSFRNVPGVTADEIKAIEALQRQKKSLVYGALPSAEAFYGENDGAIRGYAALFCEWLSGLFDIQFRPALYTWADLLAGLENGEIDFTGELTAADERRVVYFMTDSIAERPIKYLQLAGGATFAEIAQSRPPRYAFLADATTIGSVTSALEDKNFELVLIDDSALAYDALKSGRADAYFYESHEETTFDIYSDVAAHDFFPLIFESVSLSTRNPALQPVISVVQKILEMNGARHLAELYNRGYRDYLKHKLFMHLSNEELAYIKNNPVVQFAAEHDNYPVSFYHIHEKKWQGIVFDVLAEVEALTGLKFERINDQDVEWSAVLRMLENGEVSMISELIRTTAREGQFLWPETANFSNNYALLSRDDFRYININEIPHVRVGLMKDTAHAAVFRNWFPNHRSTAEYENAESAFDALGRGEIDVVMARQSRLLDLTNYRERAGYKANIIFNEAVESTFGLNKNEVVLCSILDKAIQLIDTGSISAHWIQKTYDYRAKVARMQIPWLIGAAVLLLCVIVLLFVLYLKNRGEGKRLESLVRNRTAELEQQLSLMSVVNTVAEFLLESEARNYFSAIIQSMKMICSCVEIDHVHLWQNNRKDDGRLYYKQACKWLRDGLKDDFKLLEFAYQDVIPSWETPLSQGESIHRQIDELPERERRHFSSYSIQSILAIPLFLKDEFWGFASFECCNSRRSFSAAEEHVLRSWGLLAVGAIERGRIALNMQYTLTKLEAIISNYKGVIWSIDNERIITNFNGKYLKTLGITPEFLEGEKLELARQKNRYLDILENAEKTFREGPQEWISDIDGGVFHSYTTPLYDNDGNMRGIVGSTDDVTEMVKLQRDLKAAVDAAEAASVSKSKFLANMSHEMRTPLNAIIGLSEMELGGVNLDDESFGNVEKIYNAGMNLLGIINDILDISKIESGKFSIIPVVYETSSMINDTMNLNVIRIGSKPIQFNLHVDGSLPAKLEGDELRLKQIFNNLLSNAIKYTESGSVDWSISSVREGNRFKVTSTVQDTGKGITEEDQHKLFSDYYQTDLKSNYYVEGTGLGLAITLNLIKLMGGTISLKSEFRKGSAFTVEFYQEAAGDEVIGDEAAANLSQFKYTAQRRSRNQRLIRADLSYAAVLVVDDVVTNLDVARGMLKPYKLQVDCVTSGREAVKHIREEKVRYSAIFMDHMMPGMDGIEAVRIIRNEIDTEYARTVPIIALTANALTGNDEMFLKNGFQAFLSKPIDILKLDQALHHYVRDKKKEKALVHDETTASHDSCDANAGILKGLQNLGLNAAASLPRFGGDMETYLRILQSFVTHAPEFINTAMASSEDLNAYRIAVHSIKGSGRSIGADALGDMAEKLEFAAKGGDAAAIAANNGAFIKAANELIASLAAFLKAKPDEQAGRSGQSHAKPEKESPDIKIITALRQAVESYDMTALRETIKAMDAYHYRSEPELVAWLQEKAGKSDFEAIKEKLNSF